MTTANEKPDLHVEVRNLHYARGGRTIFDGLSCGFPRGRISVILGKSGAGKSTLLRMLGCLLRPDSGDIWVDGEVELTCMPEAQARRFRRHIGMMFQGGALLDSMSVFDNVALPLREHTQMSEASIASEVKKVFDAVDLDAVDRMLPGQLSGGMKKRAALARALIMAPHVLLCDEPFSGLDPQTVCVIEDLLVSVSRRLHQTMIVTSHHIESTLRMAHHVVVIDDHGGAVSGTPAELIASSDPLVRGFFSERERSRTPRTDAPPEETP